MSHPLLTEANAKMKKALDHTLHEFSSIHTGKATPTMVEFARIWREMPKIVYSRTLDSEALAWNTTVAREVVVADIERLKAEPGGDLVVGGAELAAAFIRHDLIDEYRIYVQPVLIGRGKRTFLAPDVKARLRLLETRVFGSGVVLLRYQRAGF